MNPNSELLPIFAQKRKTALQNGSEKKKKINTMSKFENVLKAQKVRNNLVFFSAAFVCASFVKSCFFFSLFICLCIRVFLFLSSSDERSDFSLVSPFVSVQIRVKQNKTVLPTATQTRALERHDGYDLVGWDSLGHGCGRDRVVGDGVERLSDGLE